MKRKWVIAAVIVFLVVVTAVILIIIFAQARYQETKSLREILNKEVTLAKGVLYCDGVDEGTLEDDFSRVYSQVVKINVESIDETAMVAKVTIDALPLRSILESCLPDSEDGDYDTVFASYMSNVYDAIRNCPEEDRITTTIECGVIEENGLKLVPNNELTEAMFPNVQQLFSELIMDVLSVKEE